MKYFKALLLFILLAFGCTKEKSQKQKPAFNSFVFSFDGHSMKFTQRDTVFMRRRNSLPKGLLYTTISKEAQATINTFIDSINSATYDTTYIQHHLHDGIEYKFYLVKGRTTKSIFIYGQKGPKKLYLFADWLLSWEKQQIFKLINTKVDCGNLHHVSLPPFLPPHP